MKTNYNEIIYYHNKLIFLKSIESTIPEYVKVHNMLIKEHKIYLRHIRTIFSNLNCFQGFLIIYENERINKFLINCINMYDELVHIYKYTEVNEIFHTFRNKLSELLIMHQSVDATLNFNFKHHEYLLN